MIVVREPSRSPLYLTIKEPLEIGRDCSGLLLTDPQISRMHLSVHVNDGRVVLTDVGTTNGSTIDGVLFNGSTELLIGSVARIGTTTIELVGAATAVRAADTRVLNAPNLRMTSIDLVAVAVAESPPDLAASGADQGTLTIVFSDIESSTQLAEELGDERWFALLSVHNELVRRQVSRHGGNEIKAQGDGFMLTFPSARAAVRCLSDVQTDLVTHNTTHPDQEIRVRVGIHTGEVIADNDGDLFGLHVNLAARVANEAHGGEILVSSLVRDLIESRGDVVFGDPRTALLKGLAGEYTMFPILWE